MNTNTNTSFAYHNSSRIVGGSCGFGSYPSDEEEAGFIEAGYVLSQESTYEEVQETGQVIQYTSWIASLPAPEEPVTSRMLRGMLEDLRSAKEEPIQFGPNAGEFCPRHHAEWPAMKAAAISLAEKMLSVENKVYRQAAMVKLQWLMSGVYYVPAG